jgi:hypothetical protein
MKVKNKLRAELERAGIPKFLDGAREALAGNGVYLLDPHRMEETELGVAFTAVAGALGDGSSPETTGPALVKEADFIDLAVASITVYRAGGVSIEFTVDPGALLSSILFPLLGDPDLDFLEGEIRCDLDLMVSLSERIADLRRRVETARRIEVKKVKKVFVSRCNTLLERKEEDFPRRVSTRGWRAALSEMLDFMKKVD